MRNPKITPRGIRNNNPLNIRIGNTWLGESPRPTDPDFEQFVNITYGLRAAFVLLRRYIRHYSRNTLPAIIAAWAPSSENNTQRYIDFVSDKAGITPDTQLAYEDKDTMCAIVSAMCLYENGQEVNMPLIQRGYEMA